MIVNISEAKTNLSKLVDMVYHGEEVTIAKNNLPIVDLVIHKSKRIRKLGLLEGKIDIPDDFNDGDQEIEDMFYNSSDD